MAVHMWPQIWPLTSRTFLTQWLWRRGQRSNLRSPNEPPYVISYKLLIHMEAVRVIFGQIQGDYINFTMAGAKKNWLLYVPKNMLAKFSVDWCNGVSDIAETKVWRTEGRTEGRRAFLCPPFCSANGGGQKRGAISTLVFVCDVSLKCYWYFFVIWER